MLQRFAIQLALILLFAFTQIGVATHEIGHVVDAAKHTQQDKNTVAEQCEQCISYAKVANGLQLSGFNIPDITSAPLASIGYYAESQSPLAAAYAARAPPQISST